MVRKEFEHEYDLEKLQAITPRKRDFKMLVTPRFVGDYCENVYEDFTSDLLLNFAKDKMLFIDIGAHYGYYAILVGTRHPDCKIIAFEPVPENFEILKRNVALNQLRSTELHNLAVSDKDGLRKFKVTEASDSCGFYEHPLAETCKEIDVHTVCLDNLLKKTPKVPTTIKIDAEGHEPYVLHGMKRFLKDSEDIKLIIEFNPDCLISAGYDPAEFLEEIFQLGFDIYVIDDDKRMTYKLAQDNLRKWPDYLSEGEFKKAYTNMLCIKKQKSFSVLFFSHSSQLAGAERSLWELIRQLTAGYDVICSAILPSDGPLRGKLDEVGASTFIIDYHWWCDASLLPPEEIKVRLSNSFVNVCSNLKELSKINPDIIFTNTLVIPWGAVAASFLGKPHAWFIHEFGELGHNLKFYLPFQTTLKTIKDSSNLILVNSNAVRNTLFGETPPEKIPIIYPYIDIPSSATHEDQNSYFMRTEATKLIIFGAVAETKGQRDAILAVKELVQRKRDVELIIMGYANPVYLEQLKEIVKTQDIEPCVSFVDFRENPYPVVNQADIVLVCSRCEAFGRVTLEAMLLRKPVIGTNTGGTPELIKEEFNGFLYEPGDYYQLADKIDYLIQHKEKIKEFGENGYQFAKENFTKEKSAGKLAELLRKLKGAANPSSDTFSQFATQVMLTTVSNLKAEIDYKDYQIADLSKQQMPRGIVMHFLNKYQRVVERLLRPGTRRRYYYELGLTGIRVILNEGWRSFFRKVKAHLQGRKDRANKRPRVTHFL